MRGGQALGDPITFVTMQLQRQGELHKHKNDWGTSSGGEVVVVVVVSGGDGWGGDEGSDVSGLQSLMVENMAAYVRKRLASGVNELCELLGLEMASWQSESSVSSRHESAVCYAFTFAAQKLYLQGSFSWAMSENVIQ